MESCFGEVQRGQRGDVVKKKLTKSEKESLAMIDGGAAEIAKEKKVLDGLVEVDE